jgi:two-component system cell cycle sensor histidine kinase/response regulator CckA
VDRHEVPAALRDAEEALRQSEEQFRSAFSFAAIGMALVATDGRFLRVNDALCELVGYQQHELLAMTFQDITHPDELEADLDYVRRILDGEIRTYQMEKRYLHRTGREVWVLLSVSLVRAGDGSPLHFISQIQDITERRHQQEELARSEARLAEAQQIALIGSWEWDVDANVVTWSAELCRMFGVDPSEELTYERYLEHLHPDDRGPASDVIGSSHASGEPFVVEHRAVLPDGSIRWLQGRGEVTRRDGRTVAMRGTAQDITERKEVEQRLAAAELRYRTLIEQLPLVTYIRPLRWDKANLYASPQVEAMTGYPAEAWQTDPDLPRRIIHPDDRERVIAAGEEVRRTGEPSRLEYRYLAPDGRTVWVQDETYIVRDEHGDPASVQGYLIDITERKRAEEDRDLLQDELHHAQRLEALGRLAGGVAHDFNNVLTAIRSYGELLVEDLDESSPSWEAARQIIRAAEQASALPRQLLAFGRKQVLEPRLVDLGEVVGNASELLQRIVRESVELVTRCAPEPVHVRADRGQLEQVLLNLAVNARDAMPEGGTITIETFVTEIGAEVARERNVAPGRFAVLSVADTGHGMDAQTRSRAFEPFFTTKRAGQGAGLGLASVYGVVAQSGGFIDVQSEPGEGARFEIHLPSAEVAAEQGAEELAPRVPSTVTVLLVEDEDAVRGAAAMRLEREGYRVLGASSGTEALDIWCHRDDVDVVLTDMVMPGMGGRELADRILHLAPETPIVLMSGYSDEPPIVEVNGRPPSFLQKPFSADDLLRTVRQALDRAPDGGDGDAPAVVEAPPNTDGGRALTRRERDVLQLVAEGKTNDKVAAELGISAETVQTHVRNAMGKLDADNRTQAVATAIREAMIG